MCFLWAFARTVGLQLAAGHVRAVVVRVVYLPVGAVGEDYAHAKHAALAVFRRVLRAYIGVVGPAVPPDAPGDHLQVSGERLYRSVVLAARPVVEVDAVGREFLAIPTYRREPVASRILSARARCRLVDHLHRACLRPIVGGVVVGSFVAEEVMAVRVVVIVGIFPYRVTGWVGEEYRVHRGSVAEVAADEEPDVVTGGKRRKRRAPLRATSPFREAREDLVAERTRALNRLHGLLRDLVPGGVAGTLSADRAACILRGIRAQGASARLRRRLASEVLRDVRTLDRKIADLNGRIEAEVEASGTTLTEIYGIGPILAARIIGTVGDVGRFPTKANFASYSGTAPLEASSGEVVRHRLSLTGNRKLNYALHMVAVCQARSDARGGAYYRKKIGEGKSSKEALRCLKRRVCDAVFRSLMADSQAPSHSAA